MKETLAREKYIATSVFILLGNYVAFAAAYEKFGISYNSFFIYVSILIVILSEVFAVFGFVYLHRKNEMLAIVCITCSSVFFALSNVIAEYGIVNAGVYYKRYLPNFSMLLGLAPSLYSLALADKLHKTKTGTHSKLLLFACFIIALPALASIFYLIFNYIWISFVVNNTNIYAMLAIFHFALLISGTLAAIFLARRIWFYCLSSLSVAVMFLMNIIAYDRGSIVLRIMNGDFLSWWNRLTPYYYIKGFLFASIGSFSIIYIILLIGFWRAIPSGDK